MSLLKTLRARFALWTAGLLLLALLLFGFFVYSYMLRSLRSTVDDALHSATTQLIDEGLRGGLLILDDLVDDPQYIHLNEQGFSVRLLDGNASELQHYGPYQSLPKPAIASETSSPTGLLETITDPPSQDPVRVYTTAMRRDGGEPGILQVALTLRNVQRTMNILLAALLIGVPLIVLLAAGGGYFLAGRALNPIDKVTRTARQIAGSNLSGSDLSARLNLPTTDDEVGRLVTTFDSMLERLEDTFRRERQFTGDASHELRTPLTAMQTIIGSTLARPRSIQEYEEALMDLGHEVQHMRSLTEGLLMLARNDANHQAAKVEEIDLAILLKDVVDSLHPLTIDKGLLILDEVPSEALKVAGNRDGLIRLFINLLDNAIKYSKEGSITISVQRTAANKVNIVLSDSGIGIAPEHLPHIFDRFYRADSSRSTEGIGLGLAIASNIASLHGGEISVESEVGKGTTFQVTLPLSSQ